MIQMQSLLSVCDNSGAKRVICIKVLGGSRRMIAGIGDVIMISTRNVLSNSNIKKGEMHRALIVRTKAPLKRLDGSSLRFDSNAVVLLNNQLEPLGTRVFGPVPRDLREHGFSKIVSLAEEVV